MFSLRLWRKALVGYRPDWNRLVLGDLDGFRSRRSLSQLSPVPGRAAWWRWTRRPTGRGGPN